MTCSYKSDCPNTGEPTPGNDVFICPQCIRELLDKAISEGKIVVIDATGYVKRMQRHMNN